MPSAAPEEVHRAVAHSLRTDRGRLLAALTAHLGTLDLAEDCLQDAIESALRHWGQGGVPQNPRGWLLQVARRKAIDRVRKAGTASGHATAIGMLAEEAAAGPERLAIPDERLRLIFTCCHPALDRKTSVALTLRCLGGLTTSEIARAFLDKTPAMAQRLARARAKIGKAGIPFAIPDQQDMPVRMDAVLQVIYLIYNEGYCATEGADQLRADLCEEALFLARMMAELCPDTPEVLGLLALIAVGYSRRLARRDDAGNYVPLLEQDRSKWDRALIAEGEDALNHAMRLAQTGPFQLQAAIAALHADAKTADQTDWAQIAALYSKLAELVPTAVVRLNHIVARSYVTGPVAALADLELLKSEMEHYQPYHAARAELFARTGNAENAIAAYDLAIGLSRVDSERRFLERQKAAQAEMMRTA
ncbi:RNA polymerase sigma factor [Actibacterium lipolyticum]|uniref:RNA polymerase sigma factor n=1 Tax=Actibacterium lipolyticum TaxID=1524263 RepID=A0A238KIK5_9RHOB|nr:DUF6596 domain-containing protein [Actibacterium lipolyticum]SMX42635.1 RNA polymerase sigma factor [Actibacterium lipolyticum]